ncbi:DUF4810 domain-containing protein [Desulfobacter curvatus]|uniref:DUF4810 domain-containing protein n=1 Tax=Desulfobacter curvatus TaxID=2290 RepID=UPI00036D81DB|nr:DUF4810 domain-containing protein [Desulfobacter curvatus]
MAKIILGATLGFLCLAFIGCAEKRMYYFGDYSQTLYSFEKNQNEESLVAHQQVLEKIITKSGKQNTPVPPGIYAELGFIYIKKNKPKEAIPLFQAEARQYPESSLLMERLVQMAEKRDSSDSDSDSPAPETEQGPLENKGESIENEK